jgi:hypothetical protein
MTQLLIPVPLAAQQLAVVLRAKRILHEAAEVAAGRLVAIRYTTPDGAESYGLYPARVAAYARQLLGAPTLPSDGLAVAFGQQGRTDTEHYAPEAIYTALMALHAHQLAARRHTLRRLARNCAKIARLRGQKGGCSYA